MKFNPAFLWRLMANDWRLASFRWLLVTLALSWLVILVNQHLSQFMQTLLKEQSSSLLGGDLSFESRSPLPDFLQADAQQMGLKTAQNWRFVSMARSQNGTQMVSLDAVDEVFPLKGQWTLYHQGNKQKIQHGPKSDEVWLEAAGLKSLNVRLGDTLYLGQEAFVIAGEIEPLGNIDFMNRVAPRVVMSRQAALTAGLVQPASRVTYRLLVAGDAKDIERFRAQVSNKLSTQVRIVDANNPQANVKSILEKAQHFYVLVGLVALLMSLAGALLVAKNYLQDKAEQNRLLLALGLSSKSLRPYGIVQAFLVLLLLGSVTTLVAAWTSLTVEGQIAQIFMLNIQPQWQWQDIFLALSLLVMLLALYGLEQSHLAGWGKKLGFISILGFFIWIQLPQAWWLLVLVGFIAGLTTLVALGIFPLLQWIKHWGFGQDALWHLMAISLRNRPWQFWGQALTFGLVLSLFQLVFSSQSQLISQWQTQLPQTAPNVFFINILPEDKDTMRQILAQDTQEPHFYPMVRGRLTQINGKAVQPEAYAAERAKNLIKREFNLSYGAQLPGHNQLIIGEDFATNVLGWSVETGIAEELALQLGDELAFNIAGESVRAPIVNLRRVEWTSFQPNFFVIGSPELVPNWSETLITSVKTADAAALINRVNEQLPGVTAFNIDSLMAQIFKILQDATLSLLGLFTLIALSALLLFVILMQSVQHQLMQEVALLKTFGFSAQNINRAQLLLYGFLGAALGFIANLLGQGAAALLAVLVLDIPWQWQLTEALVFILASAAGLSLLARINSRKALSASATQVLK